MTRIALLAWAAEVELDVSDPPPVAATAETTYRGSCHCGAVRFEADLDLPQTTLRCDCSICRRTRLWAAVARPDALRLLVGAVELQTCAFGRGANEHRFCRRCGVRRFGIGNDTLHGPMVGINVGCLDLDDAALARIPVTHVDGRHDRWDAAPAATSQL